jgi:hypothetical protein
VCTYGFLSSVLPYSNASWEKLSIFLNFLIPKLSAPKEEDPAHGLLETMDMAIGQRSAPPCESPSLTKAPKSDPYRLARRSSVRAGTGPALQHLADIQ